MHRAKFLIAGVMGASFLLVATCASALTAEERAQLEQQLAQVEAQIKQNESQLSVKQQERTSLERDVAILDAKIQAAQLAIKQRDLTIRKLKAEIADLQGGINTLDSRVVASQESLAQILRRTREIDDRSLAELALGGSLDQLYQDLDDFQQVQKALDRSFTEMAVTRSDLSSRKDARESKQKEENELLQLQVLQRKSLQDTEREKSALVKAAKGQEANYQKILAEQRKSAAQIKATLFDLRDTGAIPFGTAYQYAKDASAATGVRPAVTLAVLRQETNLGENVGRCSYIDSMHPTRDVPVFLQIISELGRDPLSVKVSCKPSYGWGGAMGPAQFIPSTWVLYKDRLAQKTGQNPPDPWSARTAIFATAMLMGDNGADGGTREAERRAALKYFAGANWSKKSYAFYGDDVMEFADEYQNDINVIEGIASR
ncbi:lytic murein transglycosylase [Candidatus Kaiserbacteria bacterium]|nr:lytic murein transglycosylase [Candidatus Kaiserbacteria bacterium]